MNNVQISTSNFKIPSVIALALTASSLTSVTGTDENYLLLPNFTYSYLSSNSSLIGNYDYQSTSVTKTNYSSVDIDLERYEALMSLGGGLLAKSKELEEDIAKIVEDNFWDLI